MTPPSVPELRILAWEVTRRCPLKCRHCRGAARDAAYEGELSPAEALRLVDSIASFAKPLLILTGGEPMSRPDVYEIASRASAAGLKVVMSPCGHLLDPAACARLLASGVGKISVSLDGPDAESHDAFRGVPGAFAAARKGVGHAREAGLAFQVNTTVTRINAPRLDEIHALAVSLGADVFNPFLLVPTGRGKELAELSLDAGEYERVLEWIWRKNDEGPLPVRPTCAPHSVRVAARLSKGRPKPAAPGGRGPSGGCLGGNGFLFVSHTGKLQICGFLDVECGDVREAGFGLERLWRESTVFRDVRDYAKYHGKCGACPFLKACRGCRARAYAATGDYMAEEPLCAYRAGR
jgi:radical SAM protein with 4Fe4S-binding SPASM domain